MAWYGTGNPKVNGYAMEEMITIADMNLVYQVTDDLGVDRETIRVELTKEDPGLVRRGPGGTTEIVLPLTTPLEEWLPVLRKEMEQIG